MMATTAERLKILEMIQNGKISAEDGAKLLAALQGSGKPAPRKAQDLSNRYMRVRVTDTFTGRSKVSVNLPLALVDAGMNIASNFIPEEADIDLATISDAINTGLTGKIVDVMDDEDGEHVEVFIE